MSIETKRRYKEGCWGDGTFGHQHVRERLAQLVEEYDSELAERLRGEMSDDVVPIHAPDGSHNINFEGRKT